MTLSAKDRKLVTDFLGTVPDEELTLASMASFLKQHTDLKPLHIWKLLSETGAIRSVDPINPDSFILTSKGKKMFAL